MSKLFLLASCLDRKGKLRNVWGEFPEISNRLNSFYFFDNIHEGFQIMIQNVIHVNLLNSAQLLTLILRFLFMAIY